MSFNKGDRVWVLRDYKHSLTIAEATYDVPYLDTELKMSRVVMPDGDIAPTPDSRIFSTREEAVAAGFNSLINHAEGEAAQRESEAEDARRLADRIKSWKEEVCGEVR